MHLFTLFQLKNRTCQNMSERRKSVHREVKGPNQTRGMNSWGTGTADTFLKPKLDLFYLSVRRERGREVFTGTRPSSALCGWDGGGCKIKLLWGSVCLSGSCGSPALGANWLGHNLKGVLREQPLCVRRHHSWEARVGGAIGPQAYQHTHMHAFETMDKQTWGLRTGSNDLNRAPETPATELCTYLPSVILWKYAY